MNCVVMCNEMSQTSDLLLPPDVSLHMSLLLREILSFPQWEHVPCLAICHSK